MCFCPCSLFSRMTELFLLNNNFIAKYTPMITVLKIICICSIIHSLSKMLFQLSKSALICCYLNIKGNNVT